LSIGASNATSKNIFYAVLDCGRVSKESKNEHSLEPTPWIVNIYALHKISNKYDPLLGLGSIIASNVVVAGKVFAQCI